MNDTKDIIVLKIMMKDNSDIKQYIINSRKECSFTSIRNIYLCGPTTYESVHIGNLRTLFFFDLYAKVQRYIFRPVRTCVNLTDIDDKIILKAQKEGRSVMEVSRYFSDRCLQDMFNLKLYFDFTPRVSDFIGEMSQYISELRNIDKTYEKDGDILCSIDKEIYNNLKCPGFAKGNEHDFTLWKNSHLPYWMSSCGKGRPGWHLECVVMSLQSMGSVEEHFGGSDLLFPHHKNEEYIFTLLNKAPEKWMHFGLLNREDGCKMSKRLQNTVEIEDISDINALKIFYLNNSPFSSSKFSNDIFSSSIKRKKMIQKDLNICSNIGISEENKNEFMICWRKFIAFLRDFKVVSAFTHLCGMIKKFPYEKEIYHDALKEVFGISCL